MKFDLDEKEAKAVKSVYDIYSYRSFMESNLSESEKKALEKQVDAELSKIKDKNIAELAHTLIKSSFKGNQQPLFLHLPIKVGQNIKIKDSNGNQWQGVVTENPSGSVLPFDEPKIEYNYYTYYLNGTPHVIANDDHIIEVQESMKGYRVTKRIFWD